MEVYFNLLQTVTNFLRKKKFYNNKDAVRSSRTNTIFHAISILARDTNQNNNAPLIKKRHHSHSVGAARFEPATSTSQMWRDNRATLRPENSLLLNQGCGEGGIRTHGTV